MRNTLLHVRNVEPGQPLHLEGEEWDGLTFRKELIYADSFVKRNDTTHQAFTIDEMKLAHWERTGNEMIADGVKVPTPLKHTDSPEASRGHIIRYERGVNSRGVPALYGIFKFRDAEAAKLAATTDISIYVPEKPVYNGHGKKYEYPIRHVALTDYPVINGLEPFQPIAASYDEFESAPLELSILRDRGVHTAGAQAVAETYAAKAKTKKQHATAAGLLTGAAALGAREVSHIAKRTGRTAARAYKKGGIKRVGRALTKWNEVSRIKPAAPQMPKVGKVARALQKVSEPTAKVARSLGRKIPAIGAISALTGAGLATHATYSGLKGANKHAKKAYQLSFKEIVCDLKKNLSLDFNSLELGGPGSGPRKKGFVGAVKQRMRIFAGKARRLGRYTSFAVDKAAGDWGSKAGAKIGTTVGRHGAVAGSQLSRMAAPTIVRGEALNLLGKHVRGDESNRRTASYLTQAAGMSAIRSTGKARKVAASIAALGSLGLFGRKPKFVSSKKELSLGGPGSGPKPKAGRFDNWTAGDHIKRAALHDAVAIGASLGTKKLFLNALRKRLKTGKPMSRKALAVRAIGVGTQAIASLKGIEHSIRGAKKVLYPRKNTALSLAIIQDVKGNLHGEGGRFVEKPDSQRSKKEMRRELHALKPKAGSANYIVDKSNEIVDDPISSAHQAIKHGTFATLGAGAAAGGTAYSIYAVKNAIKEARKELDESYKLNRANAKLDAKAAAVKKAYKDAFKANIQAKASVTRAINHPNKKLSPEMAKLAVESKRQAAAAASDLEAVTRAKWDKVANKVERVKARYASLVKNTIRKPSRFFKTGKSLLIKPNIRKALLGVAGASAAAAAATHETKQHFDAAKYHIKNVLGSVNKFRTQGLVRKG